MLRAENGRCTPERSTDDAIGPFWMLPLLGVLGLRARDVVGYTFTQLLVHFPVVIVMLWLLAQTLTYHPPVMP